MKIYTITAGHGGSDPGATAHGLTERDLMVELRDIVASKMLNLGVTVRTDGAWRENLPLRDAMALVPGSDVAIELHTNSVESPLARGVEVVARPEHKALAQRIASGIGQVLETSVRKAGGYYDAEKHRKDRGWSNQAGFVRRGGLIVEVFFLSNPAELAKYQAKKWLVAQAIVEAITG